MPSIWFKMSNCKIPDLKFRRFSRESVEKIMGKTAILTMVCFSPLPLLKNAEEEWVKPALSHVMGLQHCIGGEGKF